MELALLVEVTTYGFLHAGMAPLRQEVLKRTWPYLPGSTLYGALQAGLIRLDGPQGVGPTALLAALTARQVRFTPLLPDGTPSDVAQLDGSSQITDADTYCRRASLVADFEEGRRGAPPFRYQTTPHAPLSRRYEQIQGSMLYAVESHSPEQRYRGWIFCTAALEPLLRRAMGLLPFVPLGGKGKYTAAEIRVVQRIDRPAFEAGLRATLGSADINVELLSPLVLQGADSDLLRKVRSVSRLRPPRFYRVWRTGLYPDATTGSSRAFGAPVTDGDLPLSWQRPGVYYVGQARDAVKALPEGSRFVFSPADAADVARRLHRGHGPRRLGRTGLGPALRAPARAGPCHRRDHRCLTSDWTPSPRVTTPAAAPTRPPSSNP